MRQIALIAFLLLAVAPAAAVHAADACRDAQGRAIACPRPPAGEAAAATSPDPTGDVTVQAQPRKPAPPADFTRPGPEWTIPPMATARCMDGTFSNATQRGVACEIHGGVAQWVR